MASTSVNALRWGALVFGVFYGFSHQQTINSRDADAERQHEYDRKARLIQEAKAEWMKKTQPQEKKTDDSEMISDPSSPKFDLEAAFLSMQKQ